MKYTYFLIFFSFLLISCINKEPQVYLCDAEKLSLDKQSFVTQDFSFLGGQTRTSIDSYLGEFSSLVDIRQKRGIEKKINDLKSGEIITVSVYKKTKSDKGYLVISAGKDEKVIRRERFSFSGKDKNSWEKIAFEIQLPFNLKKKSLPYLKVYVSLFDPLGEVNEESKEKVFFDNLEIKRTSFISNEELPTKISTDFKEINIIIEENNLKKLTKERDYAFYNQVIDQSNKKKIKGFIDHKNNKIPVKIRLKGDWTDHLIGKKWSLRVSTDNNEMFNGLKEFSLQSPHTRDFLNEWLFHKICQTENILSTYYDFYRLKINDVNYGIYAIEEHFQKQLLESKGRVNGPILKFEEQGFWECIKHQKKTDKYSKKPAFLASVITPFNKKDILSNEKSKQNFLVAQEQLLKYKVGKSNPSEYLDIESFAKAYALMSITNAQHSIIWHNQRFYFNPTTSKIEMIAYDCFEGSGEYTFKKHVFYGKNSWNVKPEFYCIMSLFDDISFQKEYLFYLKKFSNEQYLQKVFSENKEDLNYFQNILQEDYPNYKFDKKNFFNGRNNIIEQLVEYENKINSKNINYQKINDIETDCYSDEIFNHISINAHIQKTNRDSSLLSIKNYHCADLDIIGYTTKDSEDEIIYFKKVKKIINYKNHQEVCQISTQKKPKKIYFKHKAEIYNCDIINWPRPSLKNHNSDSGFNPKMKEAQ